MVTIPRLELQAAVLSAKIDYTLRRELELSLNRSYFWVDSELVLKYIKNENRRFQVYVGNRVATIRQLTEPAQWNHIPGEDNPADVISRGQAVNQLDLTKWFQGPSFLRTYKNELSVSKIIDLQVPENDPEVKKDSKSVKHITCVTDVSENPIDKIVSHFSDWFKIKRIVAWILRLMDKLKHKFVLDKKGKICG